MAHSAPPPYYDDEISLRDLYLILRRGLPVIAIATIAIALLAFLFVTFSGKRYEAESTVLINPSPIRSGDNALAIEQQTSVNFETYQRLAFSRNVLEQAIAQAGVTGYNVDDLREGGEVEQLVGPSNPTDIAPLTVSHAVTHGDPEAAALIAEAWANATVETVRASMLAGLESVMDTTMLQLGTVEERLNQLETQWREFQERDRSEIITSRLEGVAARLPQAEGLLEQLDRDIAMARGQQQVLAQLAPNSLDALAGTLEGGTAVAALELLGTQRSEAPEATEQNESSEIPAQTLGQVRAILAQANGAGAAVPPDAAQNGSGEGLASVVAAVELQRLTAHLAGLEAQRAALVGQVEQLEEQAAMLRTSQADLILERDRLEQQLMSTRQTFTNLSALEPMLSYANELVPATSRILSGANVPTDPIGPGRLLVTVLAALVGGMLSVLFVFLRAAVAEPEPRPARA